MAMTKTVTGLIPGFMALGLVGQTSKVIPKEWGPKGVKKIDSKDMIKGFVPIMVGVPLIGATSKIVSTL